MEKTELTIQDVEVIIARLFDKAINQLGLRPEQAFTYVVEETEFSMRKEPLIMKFIWQILLYVTAQKYSPRFLGDGAHAEDALEELSDIYNACDVNQLEELKMAGQKVDHIKAYAARVSKEFLSK